MVLMPGSIVLGMASWNGIKSGYSVITLAVCSALAYGALGQEHGSLHVCLESLLFSFFAGFGDRFTRTVGITATACKKT